MSRSHKKSPAGGITTARSDKVGKQMANRVERHAVRMALDTDPDRDVLPAKRELTNPYAFPKDGKRWFGNHLPGIVRK